MPLVGLVVGTCAGCRIIVAEQQVHDVVVDVGEYRGEQQLAAELEHVPNGLPIDGECGSPMRVMPIKQGVD